MTNKSLMSIWSQSLELSYLLLALLIGIGDGNSSFSEGLRGLSFLSELRLVSATYDVGSAIIFNFASSCRLLSW